MNPSLSDKRGVNLRALHLLWAVPLAFVLGWVPAVVARFERCGIRDCVDEQVGFASHVASSAVVIALVGGLAMFAAIGLTPWLRPTGLRIAIALVISLAISAAWIWLILFQ